MIVDDGHYFGKIPFQQRQIHRNETVGVVDLVGDAGHHRSQGGHLFLLDQHAVHINDLGNVFAAQRFIAVERNADDQEQQDDERDDADADILGNPEIPFDETLDLVLESAASIRIPGASHDSAGRCRNPVRHRFSRAFAESADSAAVQAGFAGQGSWHKGRLLSAAAV